MSKLIGLVLNERFGILKAQECHFEIGTDKLTQIKSGVGTGKTTVSKAIGVGLSAGSERELPIDLKAYQGLDVEEQILYGETPVFMHTTYKDGKLSSVLYIKDKDGKKVTNPVIDGKKMSPAVLRDKIKTELTFGVESFISENPKVQMDFMMSVYKEKLKEKGIVFDKKSENYQGSLLYQLDQAKMDRSAKYERVRALNAFRVALEGEGLRETSIPDFVDVTAIEKEKEKSLKDYYDGLAKIDSEINEIKIQAQKSVSIIDGYNRSIEEKKRNEDEKNRLKIDSFNKGVDELISTNAEIKKYIDFLDEHGAPVEGLRKWYANINVPNKKEFVPCRLDEIPKNEKGNYIHDKKYSDEIEIAFNSIEELRGKVIELMKKKEEMKEPEDIYTQKIECAKASNRIAERWAAFFDHKTSDEEVKRIFNEYRKIFTSIDLGVDGLRIDIIGDEDSMELRTTYNGIHDPKLFGNENKEYRPISSYSYTQKNILAILMQIHLLDEKKKAGDDGLRFLFIESPMDTKTRDLLISYQKKYDLQLLCTVTADVDVNDIKDGEIIIEDGYLISKGEKNEK